MFYSAVVSGPIDTHKNKKYSKHCTIINFKESNICLHVSVYHHVTGGEKSSLNRDSNPGPLAYRASALPTELLRPDILTDSHTPGYPVTIIYFFCLLNMC